MSVTIIAEAGVNHNGSFTLAKKMAKAAKDSGADYVKFQTFKPENLVSKYAAKADYQKASGSQDENQLQMLKKLALTEQDFLALKRYCESIGIGFLSTPFDLDSIEFLDTIGMDFWKLPSGEITNYLYLEKIAKTKKKIVLSTGMCEISEIRDAITVLNKNGAADLTRLHCNTEYPTPFADVNLLAMHHLKREFQMPVGYSDHTIGIEVPIAAAALGAVVIEKHFTLDRNMEGPDQKASLETKGLRQMIRAIRNIERSMGDGYKRRSPSEEKNLAAARKSLVAKRAIRKGELFTAENLTAKRPGNGISPMKSNEVIGMAAENDYEVDELI